ncbi:MAG: GNAT family N-acetyltransferase [Patescibacteria group bacterium]
MGTQKISSPSLGEGGDEPPDRFLIHNKEKDRGIKNEPLFKAGSFLMEGKITTCISGHPENKYLDTFENIRIEVISDVDKCFNLWREFSPGESLFDTWEFRFAFYLAYKPLLYFILIKKDKENLALLPLWYEEDKKKYFWFGSDWQEGNSFFVKQPSLIPLLLRLAPKPLLLNAINQNIPGMTPAESSCFEPDDSKYVLNLQDIKSSEDFLMRLKKNRRHDLRKDRRRIERQNPKIVVDNFSDFEHLVRLSKERLMQKGEKADWEDPRRIETFRQVIKLAGKSYKIRMVSVRVNDKIAGVDLIALFNDCYYAVKCGYDVKNFSGIGNFINLFEIEDALSLGMKKIDFLQNSYEWKYRWFQEIPLLKYEKL